MKAKILGYMVIEKCDEFEQPLGISKGPTLPDGGILEWTDGPRAVFPSRKEARKAIDRTEHYRLAFSGQHPERKLCEIVPLAAA